MTIHIRVNVKKELHNSNRFRISIINLLSITPLIAYQPRMVSQPECCGIRTNQNAIDGLTLPFKHIYEPTSEHFIKQRTSIAIQQCFVSLGFSCWHQGEVVSRVFNVGPQGSGLAFLVSAISTATTLPFRFAIADCALLEQLASDGSWGGSSGTVQRRPTSSATEADRSMVWSTVSPLKISKLLLGQ